MHNSEDKKRNMILLLAFVFFGCFFVNFTLLKSEKPPKTHKLDFKSDHLLKHYIDDPEFVLKYLMMHNPTYIIQEFMIVKHVRQSQFGLHVKISKILGDLREWYKEKYSRISRITD